jgi:hypothetical protein
MITNDAESRYYCAGRYCTVREQCHRHTSSVKIVEAKFNDYDLVHMRDGIAKPCQYFIDRNLATGLPPREI